MKCIPECLVMDHITLWNNINQALWTIAKGAEILSGLAVEKHNVGQASVSLRTSWHTGR